MISHRRNSGGFTIAVALVASVVIMILVIGMTQSIKVDSKNYVLFNEMNAVYRKAEGNMNTALGLISIDGSAPTTHPFFTTSHASEKPAWDVQVLRREISTDVKNGYYIISSASSSISGRIHNCTLHTYARVSNVGEYFSAVNGTNVFGAGAELSTAKVYGLDLKFITGGTATRIRRAEFVNSVTPPVGDGAYTSSIIDITENGGQPVDLTTSLLFPQLLDADLSRYRDLAHTDPVSLGGHHVCDFRTWGQIYPPGYSATKKGDDVYSAITSGPQNQRRMGHTSNNADHVYYCSSDSPTGGDMFIQGNIHGQVLFVAEGDIHISGNLTVHDMSDNPPVASLLGVGVASSTAHQAVLLTRKNIIVDHTYLNTQPSASVTQNLQALIYAPQGTVIVDPYPDPDGDPNTPNPYFENLVLEFRGAEILNSSPGYNKMFKTRRYWYLNSLRVNPPPDLPALTEIYYSLEDSHW